MSITFHSVTRARPIEIVHTASKLALEIFARFERAQQEQLDRNNPSRQNRIFEKVLVKANKRLGDKVKPLYVDQTKVEADLTNCFHKGRVIHKESLRYSFSFSGTRRA